MTPMKTGENMKKEKDKVVFLKFMDKEFADQLMDSGFFYTLEKINNNQEVYVFEATDELMDFVYAKQMQFTELCCVTDDTLRF